MSSEKRDTAKKKVADFDARHLFDETVLQQYAAMTITDEDGTEREVMVPIAEGTEVSEEAKLGALQYAQTLRRIESAWKHEPSDKEAERLGKYLAHAAGIFVVQNLLRVGTERFGETLDQALGEDFGKDEADTDEAIARHEKVLFEALQEDGLKRITTRLERDVAAAVLENVEEGYSPDQIEAMSPEEYDQRFVEAYEQQAPEYRASFSSVYAQSITRQYLEEALKPSEATFEELLQLLRGDVSVGDSFQVGTHPLVREIHRSVLGADLATRDHTIRDPKGDELRVRTGVSFTPLTKHTVEYGFAEQEEVLDSIQKTLLGVKKHGAALLKVHLDLTNEAYESSGDQPLFYSFSDALERLGYSRDDARRGFHRDVMRALRERVIALQTHTVASHYTKHNGKEYLTRSALWVVSAYHFSRQESIDFVDDVQTLLRMDEATAYTGVTIQPGPWWKAAEMGRYRIAVPRSVLQLSTDGKSERYALLIATFLAVHVRRNQRKHAGQKIAIRTGTLLEESGITTRDEFFAIKQTAPAKRIRSYLHDESVETGALPTLRELDAFDVEIADQREFFASGRGWKDRFWESSLLVDVPDLKIAPMLAKPKPKKRSRKRAKE